MEGWMGRGGWGLVDVVSGRWWVFGVGEDLLEGNEFLQFLTILGDRGVGGSSWG